MLIEENLMESNILWIERFEFLQYNKKYKLMQLFSDDDIKTEFCSKKYQMLTFLSHEEYEKMAEEYRTNSMVNKIENYKKQGIKLITLYSNEYPEYLKNCINPPLCLYCLGNTQLLNTVCCAVVGTRKPSEYGKIITKSFVKELANSKITIVSGMAVGVDTISHETAMNENGATIAVIAGGFNHIYPACNHNLFKQMIINNLVVSESPPDTLPAIYLFPQRNRIIAGLSKAVLITEAGIKSGALHTKNYAVESNREVFAIPGRINSLESEGTNSIIRECQGCCCTSVDQIKEFLGVNFEENEKKPSIQLDINEQSILNYILSEKKSYQEIFDHTKIPARELNTILMNMQMNGLIEKMVGNYYIALIKN